MDGEKRETLIPRALETFPVQLNMLHHLVLICCFLHENVAFLHQVVIRQLNPVQVEQAPVGRRSVTGWAVFSGAPYCHGDNNHGVAFVEAYYPLSCHFTPGLLTARCCCAPIPPPHVVKVLEMKVLEFGLFGDRGQQMSGNLRVKCFVFSTQELWAAAAQSETVPDR